jgi:hypothetical protein
LVALTPTPHEASWHDDAENELGGVHPIIQAEAASRLGLIQALDREDGVSLVSQKGGTISHCSGGSDGAAI